VPRLRFGNRNYNLLTSIDSRRRREQTMNRAGARSTRPLPDLSYSPQPLRALRVGGALYRTDLGDAHRAHAAKLKNRPLHRHVAGTAEHPAVDERRCVERHDESGAAAFEEFVPAVRMVVVVDGESRRERALDEPFEQRRDRAPPDRIDEHQMLGPRDRLLRLHEIGLELARLRLPG